MNALTGEIRLLLTAVQFFTRIPVPRWVGHSGDQLSAAARYFPLVGMLVGAATGLAFVLAHQALPRPVAVLIAIIAGVAITGGFHEDGLADTCDGFGGGAGKGRILEIMKDSRVGSYGVLGLVLALLLKFAALWELSGERFVVIAIAAHGFSRLMAVSVIFTQSYVRDDESARAGSAVQGITLAGLLYAGVFVAAPVALLGMAGIVGAAVALLARVWVAGYFFRRIGGYTGDCLGAIQQVTELAFYLGLLGWIST